MVLKKVLILEDEPNIAESLTFLFERAGFQVDIVSDGNEALDAVSNINPDVIILDVMLPNRSGLTILGDLRGTKNSSVPVLMLTAKSQETDRQKALELGATKFMTKPFSNADLLETVIKLTTSQNA